MKPNYRQCISCKKLALKQEFWRVVRLQKSNTVTLDQGEGRSAYICPNMECLKVADKKNKLGRSLRVHIPQPIYQALWQRLENL